MRRLVASFVLAGLTASCGTGQVEPNPGSDAATTTPRDASALVQPDAFIAQPDSSVAPPDAALLPDAALPGADAARPGLDASAVPPDAARPGPDAASDPCAGHCGNGAQDCGESGTDCGGTCTPCGGGTDDAVIVGHTLPNQMSCGSDATATVTVQNSGTSTWYRSGVDGYKLGYVDDASAPFLPATGPRALFPESLTVVPGASVTFDVALHAPGSPGSYTAEFQMVLEGVHWFGAVASKAIDVGCTSSPCSFPQGVPEADFIASASSYSDTDPTVDAAVNATMAALTGCGVGSSCDLSSYAGATVDEKCQSWFAVVTQSLRDQGYCAGQHIVGATDEIAVSNTGCTGKWYGYHVCNYGGPLVVWNPGARRGWWQIAPSHCP